MASPLRHQPRVGSALEQDIHNKMIQPASVQLNWSLNYLVKYDRKSSHFIDTYVHLFVAFGGTGKITVFNKRLIRDVLVINALTAGEGIDHFWLCTQCSSQELVGWMP